jgi:hypothetical protein
MGGKGSLPTFNQNNEWKYGTWNPLMWSDQYRKCKNDHACSTIMKSKKRKNTYWHSALPGEQFG